MGPAVGGGPGAGMPPNSRPMMVSQAGPGQMMARGPPPMYGMTAAAAAAAATGSSGQMGVGSPAMSSAAGMVMGHSPGQYVHSPMSQVGRMLLISPHLSIG